MRAVMSATLVLALSGSALAEVITTTDGRKYELKIDGTFQKIEEKSESSILMSEQKPYFEHFAGAYNQNSVRFMPILKNETGKVIVGFKFFTEFKSAFGDEVFSFDGESSEKIGADKSSTGEVFYYFEDNPFIPNEPYDKLKIFEAAGTGTIKTKVTAVVFDDGSVVKSDD